MTVVFNQTNLRSATADPFLTIQHFFIVNIMCGTHASGILQDDVLQKCGQKGRSARWGGQGFVRRIWGIIISRGGAPGYGRLLRPSRLLPDVSLRLESSLVSHRRPSTVDQTTTTITKPSCASHPDRTSRT